MRNKIIGSKGRWLRVTAIVGVVAGLGQAEVPLRTLSESNEPSKAVLRVHAQQRSRYPISKYLTGAFGREYLSGDGCSGAGKSNVSAI
jgi:hypothetical protein